MKSAKSYNKLTAAVIGGAATTLLWPKIAGFLSFAPTDMTAQGSAQTLITALLVFIIPNIAPNISSS